MLYYYRLQVFSKYHESLDDHEERIDKNHSSSKIKPQFIEYIHNYMNACMLLDFVLRLLRKENTQLLQLLKEV